MIQYTSSPAGKHAATPMNSSGSATAKRRWPPGMVRVATSVPASCEHA